ncbi:MAG: hypothetical protein IT425_00575 [Pirellulales bacterium]|nr:hypothetical protein [Pirellulales bacterium]
MLMESARELRRLSAPQEDSGTLVDPAYASLPALVEANRGRLGNAEWSVLGRTLGSLSTSARCNLLASAVAYTSQYRDVSPRWRNTSTVNQLPFVLSGHQPELFHPGVWFKNFVLGGLARRLGGVGIHLLIDSDLCRGSAIRVLTGTIDQPRVEAIPYDAPAAEVPHEERSILDTNLFDRFAERAARLVRPFVRDPMLNELWPLVLKRQPGQRNLGLRLALGRHAFEESWGNETLELPQSAVCQLPEFAWFSAYVFAHLPRFWNAHNEALSLYRAANRLRNHAQPIPDLERRDDWLEAPFWLWTAEDPIRRPVFVRSTSNGLSISDFHCHELVLPHAASDDGSAAAEQLLGLSSKGIKLRTRALTTTLFARLLLSDLFLHGIGGARYDQVADEIVRRFWGFEPPAFATVSATLRLPLSWQNMETASGSQWQQRLRELRYHPELFVDAAPLKANESTRQAAEWIATKRHWVQTPITPANARQRHVAICTANQQLQPFVAPVREKVEREQSSAFQRKRAEAVLRSREYSFCLHTRANFDRLLGSLLKNTITEL